MAIIALGTNPVGVRRILDGDVCRVAALRQPWAILRNAVGVKRKIVAIHSLLAPISPKPTYNCDHTPSEVSDNRSQGSVTPSLSAVVLS